MTAQKGHTTEVKSQLVDMQCALTKAKRGNGKATLFRVIPFQAQCGMPPSPPHVICDIQRGEDKGQDSGNGAQVVDMEPSRQLRVHLGGSARLQGAAEVAGTGHR